MDRIGQVLQKNVKIMKSPVTRYAVYGVIIAAATILDRLEQAVQSALRQESILALLILDIDDFGTGYSSLAYLRKLPASELKIDKSFVLDMLKNDNDAVIVKSIIDLGHNLGLNVVAEGVEEKETALKLKTLGCDVLQGYYFSKPLSDADFSSWLAKRKLQKTAGKS